MINQLTAAVGRERRSTFLAEAEAYRLSRQARGERGSRWTGPGALCAWTRRPATRHPVRAHSAA